MIDTDFFKRNANFFAFKAICVAGKVGPEVGKDGILQPTD